MSFSNGKHDTRADVAGATAGTGIVGVVNYLFRDYPEIKQLAIYACPIIAVLARYAWMFIDSHIQDKITKKSLNTSLSEAKAMRDIVFADSNSSDKHKVEMQEKVEKLEQLSMDIATDRVKNVRARLKEIG